MGRRFESVKSKKNRARKTETTEKSDKQGEFQMYKRHLSTILLAGIMTASILAGCGSQTAGTGQETAVIAEQDTSEDTPQEEPAASEQDTLAEEDGNEDILMAAGPMPCILHCPAMKDYIFRELLPISSLKNLDLRHRNIMTR